MSGPELPNHEEIKVAPCQSCGVATSHGAAHCIQNLRAEVERLRAGIDAVVRDLVHYRADKSSVVASLRSLAGVRP